MSNSTNLIITFPYDREIARIDGYQGPVPRIGERIVNPDPVCRGGDDQFEVTDVSYAILGGPAPEDSPGYLVTGRVTVTVTVRLPARPPQHALRCPTGLIADGNDEA